jgi:RNA polymerase sigma-70 factor (ECF subfamily)
MDRDRLAMLVRAHQAELYRYMRYLGADNAAAEDLVQETFLAAFRSPNPPGSGDCRCAAAWLRGIARNLFLRHCRRLRTSPVPADAEFLEQAEATWTGEFLRDGEGFDYVEALRRCLETLSAEQRRALDLRYTERTPRAEMARLLEVTENGVKTLLRRIRARLADCIRKRLKLEIEAPPQGSTPSGG